MRLTFKLKLLLLVIAALLSLGLVVGVSEFIGREQQAELSDSKRRLVPRLELGPLLDSEFTALRQGIQDAVAAQDMPALEGTIAHRVRIFDLITNAGPALEPPQAASLRWAVQDYFETARSVSRRLIEGESGEDVIEQMRTMQDRQRKTEAAIKQATGLDRRELAAGFSAARSSGDVAGRFRLAVGAAGLLAILGLWLWASRDMLGALAHLSEGFARFAKGDLDYSIRVGSGDEIDDVAREANQMATSLRTLELERNRGDWVKAGLAELSDELRGSLEPQAVAERALAFLVRRTEALAGALYLDDEQGGVVLVRQHGGPGGDRAVARFQAGEGLVGQAFLGGEIRVIEDPAVGYFKIRSGLGEGTARVLVLLPLVRFGKCIGVVELALMTALSEPAQDLLAAARAMLVVAFDAARADEALRDLLHETQRQAEQLAAQEEELRMSNQELSAQQSELRRANKELEAQQRVLSERNDEVEKARERTEEKAEELGRMSLYKSQFLANMSHELRTPLNSMLLLSHLMAENEAKNLTTKQVEYCSTIHSAGEDLLGLINQVLDLSKIESGKQEADIQNVPLVRFAAYAKQIFEPLAAEKGINLRMELDEDLPSNIATDRLRVERILTNLIGNAIKFTERGEVKLHISRPAAQTRFTRHQLSPETAIAFSVSDTGIGIAPTEQERVFAAFEQIEARSDRRYQGTGLGLAIARESAALLGGEIQLESVVGHGSTFTCYLPAERSEGVAAAKTRRSHLVDDDSSTLKPHEPYLLIIEDDVVVSEQLVELVRARGFKAIVAHTGQAGLDRAQAQRPQGIILDVKLPDVDGWTVMERLKHDPKTRPIPVHFLSALDAAEHGLDLGAIGYLTKPASRAELNGLVLSLMPTAGATSRKILVVEDSALEGQSIVALLSTQHIEATHVATAAEARSRLSVERFGCVILDLGLPDMDGLGLLESLKADPHFIGTKVIVHTGRSLTKKETRQLEDYAGAIVLKDGNSATRLLEEANLFVHHVVDHATPAPDAGLDLLPGGHAQLVGKKILLAEDDMRTVYSLSALLRSRGCDVVVAENGKEALEALDLNTDVDAILMDVMMPEMDGYEATRRIRTDARFGALPIISLTAKAMPGERERCIQAGASDYLTKPVDGKHLLTTLNGWLGPRGTMSDGKGKPDEVETIELGLVLEAIYARYGYDFRGYAGDSMRRRLQASLVKSGAAHLGELSHRILVDPAFFATLISDLTVQVSDMFRDPSFYSAFRREVVPLLQTYPQLKLWHAGCAAGEEAYATAILLTEAQLYDRTQIYVTDIDARAVEQARQGVYAESRVAGFAENYRLAGGTASFSDYYTRAYSRVVMRDPLRRNMVFFQHDLASDYAFGEMHVVFCRNVMIYFSPELKERVYQVFANGIYRNGFLCLGASEGLPLQERKTFSDFVPQERIYRLRGAA